MSRKFRRRLGPVKYDVYVDRLGRKSRRLFVGDKLVFGLDDYEKPHGGKPERGRHIHLPLPGGRELKVYLDGGRPFIVVKESRAARRRRRKQRELRG